MNTEQHWTATYFRMPRPNLNARKAKQDLSSILVNHVPKNKLPYQAMNGTVGRSKKLNECKAVSTVTEKTLHAVKRGEAFFVEKPFHSCLYL